MHCSSGKEKSLDVEELISAANQLQRAPPGRSDLAFHPDNGRILALGSEDGSVELFDVHSVPNLRLLVTLKASGKLIQSLAWHPLACGDEEGARDDATVCKDWLAVASNEPDVHVFDLSEICSGKQGSKDLGSLGKRRFLCKPFLLKALAAREP